MDRDLLGEEGGAVLNSIYCISLLNFTVHISSTIQINIPSKQKRTNFITFEGAFKIIYSLALTGRWTWRTRDLITL